MIFIDPNTLNWQPNRAGRVETADIQDGALRLSGVVNPTTTTKYDLDRIVLLDAAHRFVAASAMTGNKWTANITPRDIGSDNGFLTLSAWACCDRTRLAFPLNVMPEAQTAYENFVRPLLPEESRDLPSVAEELRALIVKATRTPYIARSIQDNIATGNNYQSLNFGDAAHRGGRPYRESFMNQIDFRGRTVLDVGANTGENSRIARRLGATLVDGYEYDPYFVEIGRLVNAAAGMTRVSLFQGDATRPELFDGMKYDIVMAFSVWVYIKDTIRQLVDVTDVLLFETHTLGHGMKFYYDRVLPHFPHAISLGYVEQPQDPNQSRMLLLFGKNKETIDALVSRRFVKVEPYFSGLAQFIEKSRPAKREDLPNVARHCFEKQSIQDNLTESDLRFGTAAYYETFLGGLHQFRAAGGKVEPDNIHLRFLTRSVNANIIDPALKPIVENPEWLQRKVANRYEDAVNIVTGHPDRVAPIVIRTNVEGKILSFTLTDGKAVQGTLDGHHRLFMALLCGIENFHVALS